MLRAARTALFSLGNLAAHDECRLPLAELREALAPLATHADVVLRQHAARVVQKLRTAVATRCLSGRCVASTTCPYDPLPMRRFN